MKVHFLGTGEAFDAQLPNTSVLLTTGTRNVLVDCGFGVPYSFWERYADDPDFLDAVYITHLHADHYFGLAPLLVRMHEDGRQKPLHLLALPQRFDFLHGMVDKAYPGFAKKLQFPLREALLAPNDTTEWEGLRLTTGATRHGAPNYAIRFDLPGGKSLMVSGDGEVTPESARLIPGCTLVVHEAYRIDEHTAGHSSVREVLAAAGKAEPPPDRIALVHTSRKERHRLLETEGDFLVPSPGTLLTL